MSRANYEGITLLLGADTQQCRGANSTVIFSPYKHGQNALMLCVRLSSFPLHVLLWTCVNLSGARASVCVCVFVCAVNVFVSDRI